LEVAGTYMDAIAAYEDLIDDAPESPEAVTALRRLIYCYQLSSSDFEDLYDYYLALDGVIENDASVFCLERLQARALRKEMEFQDALDHLDNMLEEVTNIVDSVFILVDIENTIFEANKNGVTISGGSGDAQSFRDHHDSRLKELHALIHSSDNGPQDPDEILPASITFIGNYPNPFNPSTTIEYQMSSPGIVTLKVFDIEGRLITEINEGQKGAGKHLVEFQANILASGVYIYRLEVEDLSVSNKMVLLK
ncbi:T9SS type A sorting domain-containing protein, partial [bacterium]|nr:T9SS type A sorting domain-containing protein [bacterium]